MKAFDLFRAAAVLGGVLAVASGCAWEGQIVARFDGTEPTVVTESVKTEYTSQRVGGVTRRKGQVVGAFCGVTLVYDVKEATGTAVLVQRYVAKLRTRPLRRGIPYTLDCDGPVVVQLPADASAVSATATSASGSATPLPTRAAVASLRLANGKRLRPEPRTQFVLVRWEPTLVPGDYALRLTFTLPNVRTIREKVLYTASVSCGRSRYLQPVLPPVTTMGRVPAVTIRPAAGDVSVSLPRVAPGLRSYAEAKRMLACVR